MEKTMISNGVTDLIHPTMIMSEFPAVSEIVHVIPPKISKQRKLLWALLFVVICIISGVVIVNCIYTNSNISPPFHSVAKGSHLTQEVCHTDECNRAAKLLLLSMNESVDPCEDFYEFACGSWITQKSAIPHIKSMDQDKLIRIKVVKELIDLTENITENDIEALRQLKILYDSCKQLYLAGIEFGCYQDEPAYVHRFFRNLNGTDSPSHRQEECISITHQMMKFAMTHNYILQNEEAKKKTIHAATKVAIHVQQAFHNLISATPWLNRFTRDRIIAKSTLMLYFLGYPDWLRDPNIVNSCYRGLSFGKYASFLDNVQNFIKWESDILPEVEHELPVDYHVWSITTPAVVNAYYRHKYNSIIIPFARLQEPYGNMGLRAADFGALGPMIGHEILHGFDTSAHTLNGLGLETSWWSSTSRKVYTEKTNCLVNQYNSYWYPVLGNVPGRNNTLNGELALNENIADNGGLHMAYESYVEYTKVLGKPEARLPGMENYTPEQIFFLSFAHSYCSYKSPSILKKWIEYGRHTPHKFRVIGPLSNLHNFSQVWKCPEGSRMNPKIKCILLR